MFTSIIKSIINNYMGESEPKGLDGLDPIHGRSVVAGIRIDKAPHLISFINIVYLLLFY